MPLPGGNRAAVLLYAGQGGALVFKTTERSPSQLDWVDRVQALARNAGFLVPRMLLSRSGNLSERGWTVETFEAGRDCQPEDMERLAAQLQHFHELALNHDQRPGFASARALLTSQTGGDVDLTAMPPDLVARCRAAWGALPDGPLGAIHGDLNPSNVRVAASGDVVLLDWDEARCDLPVFDRVAIGLPEDQTVTRAALAFEVACCWTREPDRARQLAKRL